MFRIVLAATAIGATLALTGCAGQSAPTPAPPTPSPVASTSDDRGRDTYLTDLHSHGVPTSVTGQPEVLIAAGVCDQLAAGTTRAKLINDLNTTLAPLAGINAYYYSVDIVDAAQRDYCAH